MIFRLVIFGLFGLLFAIPAQAAESYDNCNGVITSLPTTISTQGVWCLQADLSTAITTGNAITVNTNNVTIDCNDFKLGGLGAGLGTATVGIRATSKVNTTVRNCSIRGFRNGVSLAGAYHRVENNRFDSNTERAIFMSVADGGVIRNNEVNDTGGNTANSTPYGISGAAGVIDGNIVKNVFATVNSNDDVFGISVAFTNGASITNNVVNSLVPDGTGNRTGIYEGSINTIIEGNRIMDTADPGDIGINCFSSTLGSIARDNTIAGYATDGTAIINCKLFFNFSS